MPRAATSLGIAVALRLLLLLFALLEGDLVALLVERIDQEAAAAGVGVELGRGDQLGRVADQAGARLGRDPGPQRLVLVGDQLDLDLLLDGRGEIGRLDVIGLLEPLDDRVAILLAVEVAGPTAPRPS